PKCLFQVPGINIWVLGNLFWVLRNPFRVLRSLFQVPKLHSKSLSQNYEAVELQRERKVNQRDVVLVALLPAHQQATVAVEPTVQPLDHPPLRLVRALTRVLRLAAHRDVRGVAALGESYAHVIVVVALVPTQV